MAVPSLKHSYVTKVKPCLSATVIHAWNRQAASIYLQRQREGPATTAITTTHCSYEPGVATAMSREDAETGDRAKSERDGRERKPPPPTVRNGVRV